MANRVEITENVESALGLNITGASVTVKFRGGVQAPVYDAQNGGALLTQPLTTVNGKIGADSPSGAWVAAGDYDLLVTFGGDTLVFAWDADHAPQFVTTLPAGAGTSAPEDGEHAIELYDSANGGAWLKRYRAAVAAWDMVGGPPPAGPTLPGTPRAQQEFYVTGGSPAVQHQRYNGSSWEYVGTPPMVPITGSPKTVLDVGQVNQLRAGHQLALTDFSTLIAAPTVPVGLFNLGSTANLGTGGVLVNKGTVTFATGIEGVANAAAQFAGSTGQSLYIADTGAADPFRLKTGSYGAWFKTAKRGQEQLIMSKYNNVGNQRAWVLEVSAANVVTGISSGDGTGVGTVAGITDVADDRWHHGVYTYDGAYARLYVDGVLENVVVGGGLLFQSTAPLNISGFAADGATAATLPFFGRVDEAFVTHDVLSDDQVRLLYAAKVAHGYSVTPRLAAINVRRRRRGAALVSADFPAQPVRLHSLVAGALTDAGSGGVTLTATNTPLTTVGADGTKDGAYNFVTASTQSLNSTDAGLPAATASRSYGIWAKTTSATASGIIGWGTVSTNDARLVTGANLVSTSGGDSITVASISDGRWHFVVVTEENAPVDGLKRKLYVDGRMVGSSTVLTSLTLAGAARFRIGANPDGSAPFGGQLTQAFVYAGVLTQEQISVLYQKSSQTLVGSVKEPGMYVEAVDATNAYVIMDTLDSNQQVDLAVAA